MAKILIALTSCVRDAQNGTAQAQRDTWLQDVAKYPDVTYKFFLGDGTPTGENEEPLRAMAKGAHDANRRINYEEKCKTGDAQPAAYTPKDDEVALPVPDSYFHLVFKTKAMHKWALENEFDFVFKVDCDTYVDVNRLMKSGFEQYDFCGWQSSPQYPIVAGGGGYWLSRKALEISANAPIQQWAEDHRISNTLAHAGIKLHNDVRYSDNLVTRRNNLISTHVGFKAGYTPSMMYEAHSKQKQAAPKVLITISGWVTGATNGDHDAIRETWVEDLQYHSNLDYRIFIGDGTPVTAADEARLESAFQHATRGHKHKAVTTKHQEKFTYVPKSDEVIVPCPDGYLYLGHKSWHSHKWALDHGYDYIFQCFPDTFLDVDKLMKSGFEAHDYIGVGLGGHEREFASGGCGYWLSRKAIEVHLKEPVDDWAEDRYVGKALGRNGIKLHTDVRYGDARRQPRANNEFITEHLCDTPKIYDNNWMREAYTNSKLNGEAVARVVNTKYPNVKGRKTVPQGTRLPIRPRGNGLIVDWFATHPRVK